MAHHRVLQSRLLNKISAAFPIRIRAIPFRAPPYTIFRNASVQAIEKDAQQSIQQSPYFLKAEQELLNVKSSVWRNAEQADGFLRHIAFSTSLSSNEERAALAEKFLERAAENNVELTLSRYNLILQVFVQSEYNFNPEEFERRMAASGVQLDVISCNLLIKAYCQQGNLPGAVATLKTMRKNGSQVGEHVYAALITGYSRAGDLSKSFRILSLMEANGIAPSTLSYQALLFACVESGAEDKVKEVVKTLSNAKVFIDFSVVRDILRLLGSHNMLAAMIVVLREMCSAIVVQHYLLELMREFISSQQYRSAEVLYVFLIDRVPEVHVEVPHGQSQPMEQSSDVTFLEATLASEKDFDVQRRLLLSAVHAAPHRSHLLSLLLRRQLDDPALTTQALETFVFIAQNGIAVYSHWLLEPMIAAGKTGNVQQAVTILSTTVNLGLVAIRAQVAQVLKAAAKSRLPVDTLLAYLQCVRLSPPLLEQFQSVLAATDTDYPASKFHADLEKLHRHQLTLPESHWKIPRCQLRYIRAPINVERECKRIGEMYKNRSPPEVVSALESILATCDLQSGVAVITWALSACKPILRAVRIELFEELLSLLASSSFGEAFLELSNVLRVLKIPPPPSWKAQALRVHVTLGNVDAAGLLYDLVLANPYELRQVTESVHGLIFNALFEAGKHAEVVQAYNALSQMNSPVVGPSFPGVSAVAIRSHIHLLQLPAARRILESLDRVPRTLAVDLLSAYLAEKHYKECIDMYHIIKSRIKKADGMQSDVLPIVLKANVELGMVSNVNLILAFMLAQENASFNVHSDSVLTQAMCNAGAASRAFETFRLADLRHDALWKLFSCLLTEPRMASACLKVLANSMCYGDLPRFFGLILAGNEVVASTLAGSPGFSLPVEEVMKVFIEPLAKKGRLREVGLVFHTTQEHSEFPCLLMATVELLLRMGMPSESEKLLATYPGVPVTYKVQLLMGNKDSSVAVAEDMEKNEPSQLNSLDKSVAGLLRDGLS